jgi:hypothetical protein
MVAARLTRALKAAGIPIVGVSIGRPGDRSTWRIDYAPAATVEQRAAGAALLASFDPDAPEAVEAEKTAAILGEASRDIVKAISLAYLRDKLGRNPTAAERQAFRDLFIQAFKDVA